MNWAHIHLTFNHLPVILLPTAVVLLSWGVVRSSNELTKVGLAALVIAAATGGAVYFTGEPAEGVIENLPGVSKPAIEEHEESAQFAAVATVLVGVLAIGALIESRGGRAVPPLLLIATFILALASTAMIARTANLGGYVRHPEIGSP